MPGDNQLHKSIEDTFERLWKERNPNVVVGFDEETGETIRGSLDQFDSESTMAALENMQQWIDAQEEPEETEEKEGTASWLERASPFNTDFTNQKPLFW